MQHTTKKFLLLLAGSGLSRKEINQIVEELQNLPPDLLADSIQSLRHNAPDILDDVADSILVGEHRPYSAKRSHRTGSDVPMRVECLLRDEAGLKVSQAAAELLRSLEQKRTNLAVAVKPPNKESFYNWLQKLLRQIEPSELLHHATLVRNRYVHNTGQDWPLRER